MTQRFPVRAVAGCLALTAFGVAIIAGLGAGRETSAILEVALLSLLGGQIIGYVLALVAQAAVGECLRQHEKEHPIPVNEQGLDQGLGEASRRARAPNAEAA